MIGMWARPKNLGTSSWLLLAAFLGMSIWLLCLIEDQRPSSRRAAQLSYLPKGQYLRLASFGYRHFAADLIWLQVIQYLGDPKTTGNGFRWTFHAVDVLTELDPQFVAAYEASGVVLAVVAGQIEESIEILKKGMRNNPQVWQFPFYIGYNYHYELGDPIQGAQFFRLASTLQGAPEYLAKLAARATVEAGNPDLALEFLNELYEQTSNEEIRKQLTIRIKQVIIERDIKSLEAATREYQARHARFPVSLKQLQSEGFISAVPEEPFGGRYVINPENGTVSSTAMKERLRLHRRQ